MSHDRKPSSGTRERALSGAGVKVLIIDDSAIALRALSDALAKFQFEVVARSTAIGAPAAILRDKPDLVLIDRAMPVISGDDLVRGLRSRPELRDTIVLLCSADDERTMAMAVAACGADGWISKSSDADTIARAVLKQLRGLTASEHVIAACGTMRGMELARRIQSPVPVHVIGTASEALRRMTSSPVPRAAVLGNGLADLEPERVLRAAVRSDPSWAQRVIVLREVEENTAWASGCTVIDVSTPPEDLEGAIALARMTAGREHPRRRSG